MAISFQELMGHPDGDPGVYDEYARQGRRVFSVLTGTPVIIAAHNEELTLPLTLAALTQQSVEVCPIVIDNASDDRTAEVAEKFGAVVLEESSKGKVRALQTGIRFTRELSGDDSTLLFTDGDARPVSRWAEHLIHKSRADDVPEIATGLAVYNNALGMKQLGLNALRFGYANGKNLLRMRHSIPPIIRGHNMALLSPGDQILDPILVLPNYFPGEDIAIRDIVLKAGGRAAIRLHPHAAVFTSGDRFPDIASALRRYKLGVASQAEFYPGSTQEYISDLD